MPRRTDARERVLRAGVRLFDRQGFHGTGIAQLIAEADAPRGSFYFYFPDGKDQVAREVVVLYRDQIAAVMDDAAQPGHPEAIVAGTARELARWLEHSDFAAGCAIANVTLDVAAESDDLRIVCRDAFRDWQQRLADALREAGTADTMATDLAWTCVSALEGSVILSRAERSSEPVLACGRSLSGLLSTAGASGPEAQAAQAFDGSS